MSMINISGISQEDIRQLQHTILSILEAKADQKTIQLALKVLEKGVQAPSHTTISNCSFTGSIDE